MQKNKTKFGFGILLVLNLFIFSAIASAQNTETFVDINGKLEVIHADDFQHPENSRYIFYLNVNGKKFELQSREQLPVVISGTPVNVKGTIVDNKILVESLTIKQAAAEAPALSQDEQAVLSDSQNKNSQLSESGFKLSWHYGIIPLAVILGFLAYVETKRKIDHARLLVNHRNNKIEMLRNYIQNYLKKGFSKDQIRNALVKYHYAPHDIEEAFKGIR